MDGHASIGVTLGPLEATVAPQLQVGWASIRLIGNAVAGDIHLDGSARPEYSVNTTAAHREAGRRCVKLGGSRVYAHFPFSPEGRMGHEELLYLLGAFRAAAGRYAAAVADCQENGGRNKHSFALEHFQLLRFWFQVENIGNSEVCKKDNTFKSNCK